MRKKKSDTPKLNGKCKSKLVFFSQPHGFWIIPILDRDCPETPLKRDLTMRDGFQDVLYVEMERNCYRVPRQWIKGDSYRISTEMWA